MKKTKIIGAVLIISFILNVGFTSAMMKFGNNDANISVEQAGESNIYDFKFNVDTSDSPILEIYDDIGAVTFKSFGERVFGYSAITDSIYINKNIVFTNGAGIKDGITTELQLEDYILVIENGLIVEIK